MTSFAQRRSRSQAALIGALLGLSVVATSEDQTIQMIAAAWAVGFTVAQRAIWRCPKCGQPPSAFPWGERAQRCSHCGYDPRQEEA